MRGRIIGLVAFGFMGAVAAPAGAATISLSCGAVGLELKLCQEGADAWAKKTGNSVNVVSTPNSATERLALYQQILAAGSGDIDVYQIDVVWPGILANHFVDLAEAIPEQARTGHFQAIIDNNTVDGSLVAVPWYTDAGVLYYRKDLLEKHGKQPPKTWSELTATAKEIAAAEENMQGFVYQAKAYEGLTCDAMEWIASYGGGTIVDTEGEITINNEQAAAALTWAASTIGEISPQGVLNYTEEESRGIFQSGNAVFMRNWPYAWPLAQAEGSPVKDKVGVATLPAGEGPDAKPVAALGGWQLAVSKYSDAPDEAADLVAYLVSPEEQKRRAIIGGYNPTIEALYKDQEVLTANPFFGELYDTFTNAIARPSRITGTRYNQVSSEFFNTVHAVLSKQAEAPAALEDLASKLDRLSRGGRW